MIRALLLVLLLTACGGGSDNSTVAPAPSAPPAASLAISWTVPTKNVDGSALTDIASYRVAYGTAPTALTSTLSTTQTTLTIPNLTPGATYYATVSTVNSAGETSNPAGPVFGVAR